MACIFISYSRKDATFAYQLSRSLSNLGAKVWIDLENIPAGHKWSSAIQHGLDSCDIMIVIISPESMTSTNVEDEWQYYFDQGKPVIPVLLKSAKIHFQLSRVQYIDFSKQQYNAALNKLLSELGRNGIYLNSFATASNTPNIPPQKHSTKSKLHISLKSLNALGGILFIIIILSGITLLASKVLQQILTIQATPSGGTGEIAFTSYIDGENRLYVINSDGSNLRLLPHDISSAAWSPDGRQVAYTSSSDGAADIYVMNVDGSDSYRLTNNDTDDESPAWSPDGHQIAFESNRDGNWEIYTININGSDLQRLTNNETYDESPAWSPDGHQIAFLSTRDGNSAIYVMSTDGSDQHSLTHNSNYNQQPAWSPDGHKIAFQFSQDGLNYDIYIMNTDGSNIHPLTTNVADDLNPNWSPDGRQIAFMSNRDGNYDIYVINADGSNPRRLTYTPANNWSPQWRPITPIVDVLQNLIVISTPTLSPEFKASVIGKDAINLYQNTTGDYLFATLSGTITVIARSPDNQRLKAFTADGFHGWVNVSDINVSGDIMQLPIVTY